MKGTSVLGLAVWGMAGAVMCGSAGLCSVRLCVEWQARRFALRFVDVS